MAGEEQYTCCKCQAEFPSRTLASEHFGSKWHQFNLMRLLKDLRPISEEMYDKSIAQSSFLAKGKNQTNVIHCKTCKKSFSSQGSFETHQRSKKHKQNLVKRAAENVRRVKIQLEKDAHRENLLKYAMVVTSPSDEVEGEVKEGSYYCRPCKETFAGQKDYLKHAETPKHTNCLKILKIAEERKAELDEQDRQDAAESTMEVEGEEEEDSDWEDCDGESAMDIGEGDGREPTKSTCLLCGKRSKKIADNLLHMERHHQFKMPHQEAANMDDLMNYLIQKIWKDHKCLECSKGFPTLKGVRRHMLDKPHLSIRFEGEYDDFFDLEKILAPLVLPYKPAEDNLFALPLPDGTVLTHKNVKKLFRERRSLLPVSSGLGSHSLKRLNVGRETITHLGRFSKSTSDTQFLSIRKDAQKRARVLNQETRGRARERVKVSVKANKLQPHFRHQVINAG